MRTAGEPAPTTRDDVELIIAQLEGSWEQIVARTVQAILDDVPAYAESDDPELLDDLAVHVGAIFRVVMTSIRNDRPAERSDFPVTREQAEHRVSQGITLSDFLKAFRIGQLRIWHEILAATPDDGRSREAVLPLVDHLMQVIELGSSLAAEGYLETQQRDLADRDRLVRDLVEDLLHGLDPTGDAKQRLLRSAGLDRGGAFVVLSALPASDRLDDMSLRSASSAIGAAVGGNPSGLLAVRQNESIAVRPASVAEVARLVTRLRAAVARLARQEIDIRVGISTLHSGISSVPTAYAEACAGRDSAPASGVVALPGMSTFDYLVRRADDTTTRLMRPEIRRFVEEDLADGGSLVATFLAYVEAGLNAKTAAAELHMHPNTTYYRLNRVAERTGCDLRRMSDMVEILVAVRLLAPPDL